jgi:high-affinity Fe2+/Pb2+ permease
MDFVQMIVGVLASGVIGVVVFRWLKALAEESPAFAAWRILPKRALAYALTLLGVAVVYVLAVALHGLPMPPDWQGWVTGYGFYAVAAIIANQGAHAQSADAWNKAEEARRWAEGDVPEM